VYNHFPNDMQIGFGGITGFGNQNEWFPTLRWGEIDTTATITNFKGQALVTFSGNLTPDDYLKLLYQIFPPGPGEVGAYVSAAGYLQPGSTVVFIGPNGLDKPQVLLSLPPLKATNTPIQIRITGLPVTSATMQSALGLSNNQPESGGPGGVAEFVNSGGNLLDTGNTLGPIDPSMFTTIPNKSGKPRS
jgi:hypothetical protein